VTKAFKVLKEILENKVHRVCRVLKETKEILENKALRVSKVFKDLVVKLVKDLKSVNHLLL
jgi:hypothetical protein